ncbi:Glutaminyl-peptide cyclotransferase-like protein [Neolecta irregularis DAH-3]|uniref:Peptide hydrolase n=1 Tax=Neolecta irregularis (strain DAH-3) TaxID=1198029 RepID=A0A1U7LTZ0_NEOID|nr:Glutaminyl-peptide cyclotransferase-like protein [Neolecta irregularis DAH-3]|eukprot:OLL26145.1 Glutaminyl-peptide cyclotransferase-like protein [Neolecta irregularis DAH-3]
MKILFIALLPLVLFSSGYRLITEKTLNYLATHPSLNSSLNTQNGALLDPIVTTLRPPSSPGAETVLAFLREHFRKLGDWTIELDEFQDTTPHGPKDFKNLIAFKTSSSHSRKLVLAAHYDSLVRKDGDFYGATDSAASCAVLLWTAQVLDDLISEKFADSLEDFGIEFIFFDGEEAIVQWNGDDNTYGSRHLATKWEQQMMTAGNRGSRLSSIELFVLLDLLGSAEPEMVSYSRTTRWAYDHLSTLEARLRSSKLAFSNPSKNWFVETKGTSGPHIWTQIGDDHLHFLQRGVDVLHLIPSPFPQVWHTLLDDKEHLDQDSVLDWGVLMAAFVAEWLELEEVIYANQRDEL